MILKKYLDNTFLRWSFNEKIFCVDDIKRFISSERSVIKVNSDKIALVQNEIIFGYIQSPEIVTVILHYKDDKQYSILAFFDYIDYEREIINIVFGFYRTIDIYTDPFTKRYDCDLIKTSKKTSSYSRQNGYVGMKQGDDVVVIADSVCNSGYVVKIHNYEIGELNEKAASIYRENANHFGIFKIKEIYYPSDGHYGAMITMFFVTI